MYVHVLFFHIVLKLFHVHGFMGFMASLNIGWSSFHAAFRHQADQHSGNPGAAKGGRLFFSPSFHRVIWTWMSSGGSSWWGDLFICFWHFYCPKNVHHICVSLQVIFFQVFFWIDLPLCRRKSEAQVEWGGGDASSTPSYASGISP